MRNSRIGDRGSGFGHELVKTRNLRKPTATGNRRQREASGNGVRQSGGGAPGKGTAAGEDWSVGDRERTRGVEREESEGEN